MPWYCILLIVIGALIALSVISGLIALLFIVRARRFDRGAVLKYDSDNGFTACHDDYERLWQRTPFKLDCNGVTLSGEYVVNPADNGERRHVAIVCHGHNVNRFCAVKYGKLFYDAGYSLVLFDERYFGESTGRFCTLGYHESRDLAELVKFTRGLFGEDCVLGLHGESMGGATVVGTLKYVSPDFVVSDCPFADSDRLFREQVGRLFHLPAFPVVDIAKLLGKLFCDYDIDAFSPITAAAQTDVPICFMHGKDDKLISCKHSKDMFAVCNNEKSQLHLFEGAAHAMSFASDKEGYARIMYDFMRSVGCLD